MAENLTKFLSRHNTLLLRSHLLCTSNAHFSSENDLKFLKLIKQKVQEEKKIKDLGEKIHEVKATAGHST